MTLFDRYRKKDPTIADLESYYTGKNKTGAAWLMALLSLLITVAIIAAFFFGGRWLYRLITDSSDSTLQNNGQQDSPQNQPGTTGNTDAPLGTSSENNDFPSVVTDEAARTDVPSSPSVAQTDTATAPTATQGATTNTATIPKTGAGISFIALPILAGFIGYIAATRRQLAKIIRS